ncbi:MAG: DivIVA domain-containing protein [Actinomycetota bacterium]
MSTGDQELPLAASGEQIRQREFATVRRGYDPEQVRAYLVTLAARVDSLERDLAEAQTRLRDAESAPVAAATTEEDPYEQISRRFASVLESADTEAERVVEQARSEAERIKHEAKARAEEARIAGSQALTEAREESDRMLAALAERREAMLGQLHEMQSRLLVMTHDLEGAGQESTAQPSAQDEPAPETPQGPEAPEPPSPDTLDPPATAETSETPGSTVDDLWVATDPPPPASASEDAPASTAQDDEGLEGLFDDPAVPQSNEPAVDLPDLSSIEFDFDEPEPEPEPEKEP